MGDQGLSSPGPLKRSHIHTTQSGGPPQAQEMLARCGSCLPGPGPLKPRSAPGTWQKAPHWGPCPHPPGRVLPGQEPQWRLPQHVGAPGVSSWLLGLQWVRRAGMGSCCCCPPKQGPGPWLTAAGRSDAPLWGEPVRSASCLVGGCGGSAQHFLPSSVVGSAPEPCHGHQPLCHPMGPQDPLASEVVPVCRPQARWPGGGRPRPG